MSIPDDLVSPKAAASLLAVSVSSIYRWVDLGKLRAYRVAGVRYRVSRADVLGLVEEVEVSEAVTTPAEDVDRATAAIERMRRAGHKV